MVQPVVSLKGVSKPAPVPRLDPKRVTEGPLDISSEYGKDTKAAWAAALAAAKKAGVA